MEQSENDFEMKFKKNCRKRRQNCVFYMEDSSFSLDWNELAAYESPIPVTINSQVSGIHLK